MNEKDKQEPDNQRSVIEDLTVNEDQAAEVKGSADKRDWVSILKFDH